MSQKLEKIISIITGILQEVNIKVQIGKRKKKTLLLWKHCQILPDFFQTLENQFFPQEVQVQYRFLLSEDLHYYLENEKWCLKGWDQVKGTLSYIFIIFRNKLTAYIICEQCALK